MKKLTIVFALFVIAAFAQTGFGQTGKELTIKTARAIEEKPLDKETAKMREQALKYVIETDDVSVVACGGITKAFTDKKNKFGGDLTAAYTIGMAAFKLENPDKAADENAAQLAGLESALKSYEAMTKEKPKEKYEPLEALLTKRNNGELAKYIADVGCSK